MPEFKTKLYPHITGVGGPEGRPGVLAVTAALDPSPHYPEGGRLIIGTPVASDKVLGPLPDLGGFMMSVEGAENLIATLQQAVSDVRAATGARPTTRWEQGSHLDGFERIGRIDAVGRRSLWLKEESGAFELRAGREGDDAHVRIEQAGWDAPGEREAVLQHSTPRRNPPNPVVIRLGPSKFGVLNDVMERARFAAEWEQKNGFALAATGIEVNGYEDHRDLFQGDAIVLSAVVTPPSGGMEVICRIIVREGQHFAVQYRAGDDDWRPVAFSAVGFTPDAVLASVMVRLYCEADLDAQRAWTSGSLFGFQRTEVLIDLRRCETSPAAPGQHAVDLKQGQPGGSRDKEEVETSPAGAAGTPSEIGPTSDRTSPAAPGYDAAAKTSPADPGRERKDRDIHASWASTIGNRPAVCPIVVRATSFERGHGVDLLLSITGLGADGDGFGGVLMDRARVADLHRQLGAWLSSTDKTSPR